MDIEYFTVLHAESNPPQPLSNEELWNALNKLEANSKVKTLRYRGFTDSDATRLRFTILIEDVGSTVKNTLHSYLPEKAHGISNSKGVQESVKAVLESRGQWPYNPVRKA